ncbi:MAG: phosphotransferase [Gammaproteobacteria bacterium]
MSSGALEPASGDASFRRYFRVCNAHASYIAVDAPPQYEDSRPFVRIARWLVEWGLNAPQVIAADLDLGFLLLSDLGSRHYLDELDEASVERLYGDALGALAVMQVRGHDVAEELPPYDEALLMAEMALFDEWYLQRHLSLALSDTQRGILAETQRLLVDNALAQPRVFVHRDYHSRNLLRTERNNPGILDFQDAVWGPVTYDLVSLLRDCYIAWPAEQVQEWALGYRDMALQCGVMPECDEAQFLRWFDLMGVQRHLKASGIFARLNYRDGKSGYLKDIPRTLAYVDAVCAAHPELGDFRALLYDLGVFPPTIDD